MKLLLADRSLVHVKLELQEAQSATVTIPYVVDEFVR